MNNNDTDYNILYVDDETKALKYFSKAFSERFSVITCDNVTDAKKILDENTDKIAVLISDQRMPEERGTDLLSYSRQHHPHIVRLLTTAYSDLKDTIDAVNDGEIFRYINKPWDINALTTDLQNAMRFFILRHERDQLLNEKLNVKQRLLELNRIRDLIVMASGFTHVKNPLHAIRAFLLQVPINDTPQIADLESLDVWSLLEQEIQSQLSIADALIKDMRSNQTGFELALIKDLVSAIESKYDGDIGINTESSEPISINKALVEIMLLDLIDYLPGKKQISTEFNNEQLKILINNENNQQNSSSLLSISNKLLNAFFITYHHNGEIILNNNKLEIRLPSDPMGSQLAQLDDNWLEEIFYRFENWSN